MLRAINAANSATSAAPMPVREAQGAAVSSSAGSQPNAVAAVESHTILANAAVDPQTFRFNSTQFVYRQDIGRIILIGQSPVTGERKIQIPSEEALRAYERTIRAEEQRNLLTRQAQPDRFPVPAPQQPAPSPTPASGLSQALGAVFGGNQGSAGVSVSA